MAAHEGAAAFGRWECSQAKKLLQEDLESGRVPLESNYMKPKDVYNLRPEYQATDYSKFAGRLRSLRKILLDRKERAVSDTEAYNHDRLLYPKPTHNERGEPRWEGSAASLFLDADIDEYLEGNATPQELYASRDEYQEYSLKVFSDKIQQVLRTRRFNADYGWRRNER
ncbi:hypothetical protein MPSEU_000066700 [Mayamaea pseudoterrestris]|nr:hypothetical protein MPSEU_000066700 [Mayamaea pseudoterrestris]